MKYAVVKIGGSQYKIKEGDELDIDRLPQKEGETVELSEVLLVVNDGEVQIGQPLVEKVKIKAKVLSHLKGEKVRVARFRAKSRYRKVRGFRAALSKIKIEKIGALEVKEVKKEKKLPVAPRKPRKVSKKTS